ncbi:MAG: hypothetical protein IT175_00025 [Acidobacteria bacterium]|nr:hypothetical protein [Acidobacteriota bacterium]
MAMTGTWGTLEFEERVSLELNRAVATKLAEDPEFVIGVALRNLDRWRTAAEADAAEERLQRGPLRKRKKSYAKAGS